MNFAPASHRKRSQATPVSGRPRSSFQRKRLCAGDVLDVVGESPRPSLSFYTPPPAQRAYPAPRSGNQAYQPNQSLYDGHYEESDSSDIDDLENNPPLENSQACNQKGTTSAELVKAIQEQQQLLQQVLENQKKMESKQEEYDNKLEDLTKRSESISPDTSNKKRKFKIKRNLTVS